MCYVGFSAARPGNIVGWEHSSVHVGDSAIFGYRCQCRLLVAVIGGCQIALAMHVSPVLDSYEWESCILFGLASYR